MENVTNNCKFLSEIVNRKKPQAKAIIRSATDSDVKILIELILNIDNFGICNKQIHKQARALKQIKWKLTTARKHLVKHFDIIKSIVALAIAVSIEKEICEIHNENL